MRTRTRLPIYESQDPELRACGACTACCTIPPIPELGKPANTPCVHLTPQGCGIYDTRPEVCRAFYCNWRFGLGDPTQRPDRVGYYSTGTKNETLGQGLTIHAHKNKMGAWEKSSFMRRMVRRLVEGGGTIYIISGEVRRVLSNNPAVLKVIEGMGGKEV